MDRARAADAVNYAALMPFFSSAPAVGGTLGTLANMIGGMSDVLATNPEQLLDPVFLNQGTDPAKIAGLERAPEDVQFSWQQALGQGAGLNELNVPEGYVARRDAKGNLELAVRSQDGDLRNTQNPLLNAAIDAGHLLQLGSGAGPLATPGTVIAQALGDLPLATEGLGTFAGVRAARAPTEQFFKRDLLKKAGYTDPEAHQMTGVSQPFKDQPARWEISDDKAKFTPKLIQYLEQADSASGTGNLSNVLEHPELFEQYPMLADVRTSVGRPDPAIRSEGEFWGVDNYDLTGGVPGMIRVRGNSWDKILSALLHEIQHGVQTVEGWQNGASPEALMELALGKRDLTGPDALGYYRGVSGEVEARNTQQRQQLNRAQRNAVYPHLTQDIVPGTEITPEFSFWNSPLPEQKAMEMEMIRRALFK